MEQKKMLACLKSVSIALFFLLGLHIHAEEKKNQLISKQEGSLVAEFPEVQFVYMPENIRNIILDVYDQIAKSWDEQQLRSFSPLIDDLRAGAHITQSKHMSDILPSVIDLVSATRGSFHSPLAQAERKKTLRNYQKSIKSGDARITIDGRPSSSLGAVNSLVVKCKLVAGTLQVVDDASIGGSLRVCGPILDAQGNIIKGNGAQGPIGPRGVTGATGPDGKTVFNGETGPTGTTGFTGPLGPTGHTGRKGPTGATGAVGDQGPQGIQGDVGPQGDIGPQGDTGSQGDIGPQGDTGLQGNTGVTGVTGVTGIQGVTGATGADGMTVMNGATGATGLMGVTGVTGATGSTAGLSEYAYIYSLSSSTLNSGDSVPFDVATKTGGIAFTNGGSTITINDAGVYFITFSVASSSPNQFELYINSTPQANTVYGTTMRDHQNTGQAILSFNNGDVLTLQNVSPGPVTLHNDIGGSDGNVSASIVLLKLV
jgi:hypothetical protein